MRMHSKKDIYYLYRSIFIGLIPLIIFGIVKNGLLLYKETSSLYIILKPLIYFAINFVLGIILDIVILKEKKINKYLVYLTLLFMISSINTPIWLYLLGDICLIVLIYKDKGIINKIAFIALIIALLNYFLKTFDYGNIMEITGKYIFSFTDLIFLRQVGGIATSNLILAGIVLIILLFNTLYKRNIALLAIVSYIVCFVGLLLITKDNYYLNYLINSTALFEIIMISTINEYTPYTPKGEIVYGILLGLIGALLCKYTSIYTGILISIIIMTPLKIFLDKNKHFS